MRCQLPLIPTKNMSREPKRILNQPKLLLLSSQVRIVRDHSIDVRSLELGFNSSGDSSANPEQSNDRVSGDAIASTSIRTKLAGRVRQSRVVMKRADPLASP